MNVTFPASIANRSRVRRARRIARVTVQLAPHVITFTKQVGRAYAKAWEGPPPRKVVHLRITVDASPALGQLRDAREALERIRAAAGL